MTEDKRHRKSFRFNLKLVLAGLRQWPIATTIVATILATLVVGQLVYEKRSDPTYIFVNLLSIASAIAGMKIIVYLMAHPFLKKSPFPGSYLVAVAIAMVPIFVFYGCGFYLLGVQGGKFSPVVAMLVLFVIGYPLFTVFVAGFLRANEFVQLNREEYLRRARHHGPFLPEPPKRED